MDAESTKLVMDGLRDLAAQIGVTVDSLWPALVGRVMVDAWTAVGIGLALLVCGSIAGVRLLRWVAVREKKDHWDDSGIGWAICGVLCLVAAVVGLVLIGCSLANAVFPEAAALSYFRGLI